ncbi:peptidoglycan DD-metalloendopeptidase family protein [Pseudomonas sp. gcc21]|uniref:murein hydrolase activator EnvC family protein n=1 Tax=Pseudomonas sp. gcc21 TaxID=2726989 RepID=UPI0014521D45|nr:peptidoglycan DD-metalloendopeptidase family protein [Pseudomonas sp. gcc21]QJD59523.1 peptidoglycan DD-metalloendopeptidase family protein [Pseudomonas sp. gcc21]
MRVSQPRRSAPWRAGVLVALMAFGGALALPALAQDSREAKAELKQTEQEIARLKKMLGELKQDMSGLERELKQSESEIGRLQEESEALEQQIEEGETRIDDLRGQAEALQVALQEQEQQIARQARSAYMAGQQDYLKLVLNQDDPARVARMMRYYEYVSRARMEEITTYNHTLAQIRQASAAIAREQAQLHENREQLAERQQAVEAERETRAELLASLKSESRTSEQQLKQRQSERAELAALIKKLDEAITSIPTPAGSLPFADAKGKLPLPVKGSIQSKFGSQRGDDARLKWDGLVITAEAGTPVHAIHGGRVVFADWLRGSGLLLILDHGNGYLSLYGHNQTLLRDVGTWVQPGEAIATVGSSGGLSSSSLYFSIRKQGRALDPLAWCMLSS